jgi:beta-hydroxylase
MPTAEGVAAALLSWKATFVYGYIAWALFVHFRGRERHKFHRQLTDHSTVIAPYNAIMYGFSAVPTTPFVDVARFPELRPLQENWQVIRDEALRLMDDGHIRAAAGYNDLGFNSFFRRGWKRFYLKWYDAPLDSARALCPRTVALVEAIPAINGAMFAMLPAGGDLGRHRDPFAGSMRYHLGLATPNSENCRIFVDGQPYHWRDGEGVVFDETFIHWAENRTDKPRMILFCDVERPLTNRVATAVNRWVSRHIVKASATANLEGERVGALNRFFVYFREIEPRRVRLKNWNKKVYYVVKWGVIGSVAALLVYLVV